jgi:PHD/YefM family antitoxin component YafN of YafNO toxin-antitoxin module
MSIATSDLRSMKLWNDDNTVNLEHLARIIESLSQAELETLEILMTPGLVDELQRRREEAAGGEVVSLDDLPAITQLTPLECSR